MQARHCTASAIQIIFKLTPHCNIACSYCYQSTFDHHDWFKQPRRIAQERFEACMDAICVHAVAMGQVSLNVVLQGGEPLLVPRQDFACYLETAHSLTQRHGLALTTTVQTNGVLLNREWCTLLCAYDCGLAISVDGPRGIHDARRIRRDGRGTFEAVQKAFVIARSEGMWPRALTVLHPALDGTALINLYESLGVFSAGLILPAHNHLNPDPSYDPASAAYGRMLCAAFDAWLESDTPLRVHNFDAAIQAVIGGRSSLDGIGESISDILSVAPDGQLEDGDAYGIWRYRRIGGVNFTNALEAHFRASDELRTRWAGGLPVGCRSCDVADACRGGMLEHRYGQANGLDNPSYYCADLKMFYRHVQDRLRQTGVLAEGRNLANA